MIIVLVTHSKLKTMTIGQNQSMMNASDLDTLLNTPVGKLHTGRKRGREDQQEQKESEEEVSVQKDIMKYSDKISVARKQLAQSAECTELLSELNSAIDNAESEEEENNLRHQKDSVKSGILPTKEIKAIKEKLILWESLMESASKQLGALRNVSKAREKQHTNVVTQKLILESVRKSDILKRDNVLDAVKWVRMWKKSLETTNQTDQEKCAATMYKLDTSLQSTFGTIMEKSENMWIRNNLAREEEQKDKYLSSKGIQYHVKRGQKYSPDFEFLLSALLKEMLQSVPEESVIAQLDAHEYHEGAEIASHIERFRDLITGFELIKGKIEESSKVTYFFKTLPHDWIDRYEVPARLDLTGAINWAQEKAREKDSKNEI